jgi:hypothetical protein
MNKSWEKPWSKPHWLAELHRLQADMAPYLAVAGIAAKCAVRIRQMGACPRARRQTLAKIQADSIGEHCDRKCSGGRSDTVSDARNTVTVNDTVSDRRAAGTAGRGHPGHDHRRGCNLEPSPRAVNDRRRRGGRGGIFGEDVRRDRLRALRSSAQQVMRRGRRHLSDGVVRVAELAQRRFLRGRVADTVQGAEPPPGEDTSRTSGSYPSNGQDAGRRDTGQEVTFYIYRDARERFYLGVKRTTTKQFPQYHWDSKQWIKGLPKGFLKIPYRLPELLDAPADEWVVIADGEKDAETAVRLGFIGTTNPGGEGKGQWTPELNKWFAGRKRVAIMEDNDKAGQAHVIEVANAPRGVVPDIRIVQFRELPEHGDLTDWIETDPKRDHTELLGRIEASQAATGYELIKASAVVRRAVQWWWPGQKPTTAFPTF